MGVHRALLDHARHRILSDDDPTGLAHDLRAASNDAFTLLERGIGEFGRRTSRASRPAGTARRQGERARAEQRR
jgi:hypothetical protein